MVSFLCWFSGPDVLGGEGGKQGIHVRRDPHGLPGGLNTALHVLQAVAGDDAHHRAPGGNEAQLHVEKVLKIGIIGCGAIGKDHCRRIIETVPGATVVAVSDYVAAAADETAAKYGIKSYGNDCDGMIKDPEVEAVVITSIDPTHHDYVMKTLAEEKWCFCEKPLSQNAADCEDIIKREQEIGKRLVQVGFMRHYDRGYAEMKRIIASGELGKPLIIKACHRNVSQGPAACRTLHRRKCRTPCCPLLQP